jgi:HK97 family phage portal protein
MSLWRWVGKKFGLVSDFWGVWFGTDSDSGEPVTPETAMKLSAWWACVRLIAETIATLPCGVYVKDGDDRRPLTDHPLYRLLHDRPNSEQTPVEFWEGRVAPICIVGNSYAEKMFIGDRLVALDRMPFQDVAPRRTVDTDWRLVYRFTDRGKQVELPAEKVFHIRGFSLDGDVGLSPVGFARRSLGGAMATERAAARVYGKGLRATGVFSAPTDMTPEQRKQFRENYVKPAEGPEGEGKQLILPPGFEWHPLNIPPKDAEMLMSRGFNVEDICRWMGVPPILVGHSSQGQTMWGSGVEQIILGWLVLGLRAYLKRIEAAVNSRLISDADRLGGIFFEFNFEGLLRADSAGRAAFMASLAQNGLRTRDELRKLDNLPGMPGGDQLTVQSNLVPLDQLGQQQAPAAVAVRNALRAWLLEERDEREAA